jgi:hypothetical protein
LDGAARVELTPDREEVVMALILIALLVVLILGGLGFVLHILWWIALIALVLWLLGFVFRTSHTTRRRWYRW